MKTKSITIFEKGLGLREINRTEWDKMFDELYKGKEIEVVEIHY